MESIIIMIALIVLIGGITKYAIDLKGLSRHNSKVVKHPMSVPVSHSNDCYEALTEHKKQIIRNTFTCPDCSGSFLKGPRGGMMINFKCDGCGAEFNLSPGLIFAQRISDRKIPIRITT